MSEIKSSPDLHRRVMGAPVARIVQKVDRVDSVRAIHWIEKTLNTYTRLLCSLHWIKLFIIWRRVFYWELNHS